MTNEETIFAEALGKGSAPERDMYLKQACAGDADLRRQVEALLVAHQRAGGILEASPLGLEVTGEIRPSSEGVGATIGPYKLLQQIGEGGMGIVYMAEQRVPVTRKVALKIIKLGMDTKQVIARFEAERQALALMDHPNIARVLEAGATDSGRPYFVMELVKGVPITRYCDERHVEPRHRLELFVQVCQAVQHAHQKGIIHRDIKPTNVLVAEFDEKPVARVIDFGVAKAVGQQLTEKTMFTAFGQVIGTIEYMSPEHAKLNQLDVDTRSDIYSLGVLLYELLTGETPFDRKRLQSAAFDEMLRIIREEEPVRPSTRLSTTHSPSIAANRGLEPKKLSGLVHGELDWIVMKSLEKDRGRRYETANGFATDVQRYLDDEAVQACPASATYRLKKIIHRHKAAFAATLVIVAASVIGMGTASWGLIKARQGRTIAENARQELAAQLTRTESAEQLASTLAEQLGQQLYHIQLPQAATAVREGQFAIARQHLNACPENQRNWEWQWLAKQVDLSLHAKQRGRQMPSFTPDGSQILAVDGADEKSVKIWNVSTGAELRSLAPSTRPIKQVAVDTHNEKLATGTDDGTVTLWDLPTGRQLWSNRAHDQRSDGLAFSPDGARLASASWDGTLKVFSTRTGEVVMSARTSDELRCVCFSPDGARILTAGRNSESAAQPTPGRVWDAQTGQIIFEIPDPAPRCAAYSPDGKWIACGYDRAVRIYDASTGERLRALEGHEGKISGIAYSPDGARLATSCADTIVRVWDPQTGKLLGLSRDHSSEVNFVSFQRDGERLASTDKAGILHIWNLATIEPCAVVSVSPAMDMGINLSDIWAARISPDGKRIITGNNWGEVRILNAETLLEERILPLDCMELNVSRRGEQFATAGVGTIGLCNSVSGAVIRELDGHQDQVANVAFSPDGTRLASSGYDETIRLWDVSTGAVLHVLSDGKHTGTAIWAVAFAPNGKQIVCAGGDRLQIWDAATGARLHGNTGFAATGLTCVAYSPDGRRIFAGGVNRLVQVWDAETGAELPRFSAEHTGIVSGLALSPDGSRLVSCDTTGMVRLWEADTGSLVLTLHDADGVGAHGVDFSRDGRSIVAAKADGTILLWEAEPPAGGNAPRAISQAASQVAAAALCAHEWSGDAIAAIRQDESLSVDVKRVAIRLAEERIRVEPGIIAHSIVELRQQAESDKYARDARYLSGIAWVLLKVQPTTLRDPAAALPIAKRAVEINGGKRAEYLAVLAEACFANGDIPKAVENQQKAVGLLAPDRPDRHLLVERLEQFKALPTRPPSSEFKPTTKPESN